MAYTRYTREQLAEMSDNELNEALANLLGHGCVMFGGVKCPDCCSDWAATGPLMPEYHISLFIEETGECVAYHLAKLTSMHDLDYNKRVYNDNPLRAVVECLVLVLQEDNT